MSAIPRSANYTPSVWGAKFHDRREQEVFGAGAAGPGKALSVDTVVPTPMGLKTLGEVHPGEVVFGIRGERVRVIAETPVQIDRPCYRFKLGDQFIVADSEHEWVTVGDHRFSVKTTKEIADSIFTICIPAAGVADFGPPKPLIVDPYVFGVCLILGQPKDRSKFHGWDLELYSLMQQVGYHLDERSHRVSQIRERRDVINELIPERDRRIPWDYLSGSLNQRMALVEGIMDGAGGAGPTCLEPDLPFISDFYTLCASVGLGPELRKGYRRGHGTGRFLNIRSRQYRCTRRHDGGAHKKQDRSWFEVTALRRVPSVPVKCIQVEGGTYCITPAYIPTHNSMVLLADPLEQVWVEHIRCLQDEKAIPPSFPADIKRAIVNNPLRWGYSEGWALHLRRTLTRLGETVERAHRMFPLIDPDVDWNEKNHIFTFSSGFKYQFGHCKDKNDHTNYLGQQYSWVGFDELIEFLEQQYHAICARCRSGDQVLMKMLKRRAMSNPKLSDAKGESIQVDDPMWVRRYFVDPAPEGNKILRRKITLKDGSVANWDKLFLPATLYDNPDKDFVRQYEIELRSRPKHIQDAYLHGKWDSVVGSYFEHSYNPDIHRCRPFKIPQSWPIFRSCDWGYVSEGCVGYYALDPTNDTLFKFWECVFKRKKVAEVVSTIIKPFEQANKLWSPFKGSLIYGPADTQIWEERGESALSKYQEFVQNGVDWCYADKRSREDNAQRVHERLTAHENFSRPPKLIFFDNCKQSYQVLSAMQTDPHKPTEPMKGGFDHPYDETSYACAYIHGRIIDPPNYKARVVEKDDDEPDGGMGGNRNSFGYWMG